MCDETHHVTFYLTTPGFAETRVEFDLIPTAEPPPEDQLQPEPEPTGHSHMEG